MYIATTRNRDVCFSSLRWEDCTLDRGIIFFDRVINYNLLNFYPNEKYFLQINYLSYKET